jgi:hypothetical protein
MHIHIFTTKITVKKITVKKANNNNIRYEIGGSTVNFFYIHKHMNILVYIIPHISSQRYLKISFHSLCVMMMMMFT